MTPQEWASAASKLSRANPGLTHAEVISRMEDGGMPRPPGVKNNGYDKQRRPMFKARTRSQGQKDKRSNHEKTSTTEAADQLAKLKTWQQTINNMAAAQGMEGWNQEHAYPSDHAADVILDRGRAGDYTYLNPDSDAEWKTAVEQYIRSYRDNRYRLLRGNFGDRIVDTRYADDLVDPQDLPGMDVDPSMTPEQIFTALPIIVRQDLSMRQTQFPGTQQQPGIQTTAGKVEFKPGQLGGFVPEERTPYVTPPSPKYVPPLVQQYSYQINGNGNGNGNGNVATPAYVNGGPPTNGNGGNGANYQDQNVADLMQLGQKLSDASLVFRAGKVIWDLGTAAVGAFGGALTGVRP